MALKQIFFCLVFLQVTATITLLVSSSNGELFMYVNHLHSKLLNLWRGEVHEVYTTPTSLNQLSIGELVESCMRATTYDSPDLIESAIANAEYLYKEFRKVIPETGLTGYSSHCWMDDYSIEWDRPKYNYQGKIGNITFSGKYQGVPLYGNYIFPHMTKDHPNKKFTSGLTCLPRVFLVGFAKCGTTPLFFMMKSLMSGISWDRTPDQVDKESRFWAYTNSRPNTVHVPEVGDLGHYIFNYAPGIDKIAKHRSTSTVLVDATPNIISMWPLFRKEESSVTNYCILPVVLPRLFPDSKYIVVMRNPISRLYSSFWLNCRKSIRSPSKGPDIFHQRIKAKIAAFNACMKDESVESISSTCSMLDKDHYSSCIRKRLHFLDRCVSLSIKLPKVYPDTLRIKCGEQGLSKSIFFVHIRKWLQVVPRERMKFMTIEEVSANHTLAAYNILEFLDMNTDLASDSRMIKEMKASGKKKVNKQKYQPMRSDTLEMLKIFYHPFNTLLAELLGDDKYQWF